jgi:hypothetical protein
LVVVFVPSLCSVVELVLDFPLGSDALVVLVCFDGSLEVVVLFFWPSGFSVVVVLEADWANAAPPTAKLKPRAAAANFDLESMFFLLWD